MSSIPSEVRKCAVSPDNLRSEISFSRTYFKFDTVYISHSPFNAWNASLFVCLHGCAIACTQRETKQTFAQCITFLAGTLFMSLHFLLNWYGNDTNC